MNEARGRRALPLILIILATIIGIVSVFALWGKRQLLENETFSQTSGELIQNEEIQTSVADFLTTSLFDNVDVQAQLAERLPPNLQPLAGPATGALRNLVDNLALRALQQPRVQALWEDAISTAHAQLIKLIKDEGEFVSTTDGVVTVDLQAILADVASQIGINPSVTDKLPPQATSFEVMRSDELKSAQKGIDLLQTLAYVLTALTLILYVIAIAIAGSRRRQTLRNVGISFISIGAVVLLGRNFGANVIVDQLSSTPATDAPIRSAYTISTSLLKETGQSLVIYGIVIILAAVFAGPSGWATSVRRFLTPYLRQPQFAYGALAVLLVLLFWWNPVVATDRLVPSLILVVALLIGTEVLRRQVIREFPNDVTTHSPAGVAQQVAARINEAREKRVSRRQAAASSDSADDDRIALLERLGSLHDKGLLTDDELAAEKQRLLST
ncbi:MAG: SHOCT domain-containing protein [Solirubrobacterales bacterium]|nr:SHOCT domain-containing protein [Myxococcales bacterium]MCO5327776.1 SHOCT domain-containing protein [Solirubrobacterales bacterium]